jgi:hypothetical protein
MVNLKSSTSAPTLFLMGSHPRLHQTFLYNFNFGSPTLKSIELWIKDFLNEGKLSGIFLCRQLIGCKKIFTQKHYG